MNVKVVAIAAVAVVIVAAAVFVALNPGIFGGIAYGPGLGGRGMPPGGMELPPDANGERGTQPPLEMQFPDARLNEALGLPEDASKEDVLAELGLPEDAAQEEIMDAIKQKGIFRRDT